MIARERRWAAALAEHEIVVSEFLEACRQVTADEWDRTPATGKWSPAALVLHVCLAYEEGLGAVTGGRPMRLRVSARKASLSRMIVLPIILRVQRFPRGVKAPAEVVPDLAEARLLTPASAAERLQRIAGQAATALRAAADQRPEPHATHAYFGRLSPYLSLRLLSAHTRHHTRGLTRWLASVRHG